MANDLSDLADTMEVAATTRPGYDMAIGLEVAEIFVHMLGDGRSVIDPTAVIWTAEAAEELRRRIEDNPILGTDAGQWDKLEHQLADLGAELLHFLLVDRTLVVGLGLQAALARLHERLHPGLDLGLLQVVLPADVHEPTLALDQRQKLLDLPLR